MCKLSSKAWGADTASLRHLYRPRSSFSSISHYSKLEFLNLPQQISLELVSTKENWHLLGRAVNINLIMSRKDKHLGK